MKILLTSITTAIALTSLGHAASLITPTAISSSTSGDDFRPAGLIINNGGIEDASNSAIVPTIDNYLTTHHVTGYDGISWVTNNPGGSADYFASVTSDPVLTIDLGASYDLTDFVYWGYDSAGSGNEASAFILEFSTDNSTFTNSESFDRTGNAVGIGSPYTHALASTITAQYVKVTITDNQGGIDRVALGEVKFIAVPEPSSAALLGLGALALVLRRRKA